MMIEAIKPIRVRLPEKDIQLIPGQPTELPDGEALKLLSIANGKVRLSSQQEPPWSEESLASERKFGCWEARLYPLLHKTVLSCEGEGQLVQVFAGRVAVLLDRDKSEVRFFSPQEIRPVPRLAPQVGGD